MSAATSMRTSTVIRASLITMALFSTFTMAAAAAAENALAEITRGSYVQLGLGAVNYGDPGNLCNSGSGSSGTCSADSDTNARTAQLDVGFVYRGVDLSAGFLVNDHVKVTQTFANSTSSVSTSNRTDAQGFYFLIGCRIPVFQKLSVIPQVGVLRSTANVQESITTTVTSNGETTTQTIKAPNASSNDTDATYGIEAAWQATPRAAVIVSWRRAEFGSRMDGTADSFVIGGRWSLANK